MRMRINSDQEELEEFTYDADQGGSDFINSLPTPEIKTTEDLIAAATPAAPAPKPTDAMLRGKELSQTQFEGMTPVYESTGPREGQRELLGYKFGMNQIQEPGMTASYSAPVYESKGRGGAQVLVDPGGKLLGYEYTGTVEVPKPDAILAYEKQFGTTMEPIYGTRAVEGRGADRAIEYGPPIGYRFDNGKSQYVNFDANGQHTGTVDRERPGAFGNILLSMVAVAYPPAAPFIQAYNAIKAIDSGDTLGFILSAAGASAKIPGLDASTTKLLSDVSTGAKIIKAVETGDPLKIASSMVNLPGVDPDLKDLSIVVNTAKAINDGNISGAFNGIARMSDRDSIGRLTDRFDDIVSSSGGGDDAATIDNTEGGSGGPTPEEQAAQEQEDREQTSREQIRASERNIEDTLTDSGLVLKTDDEEKLKGVEVTGKALTDTDLPITDDKSRNIVTDSGLPITGDQGRNRVTDSNLPVNPNVGTTTPTLERKEVSGKREIDTDLPITSDTGGNRVTDSSLPVNPNVGTTDGEENKLAQVEIRGKREVADLIPLEEMPPLPSSKVTPVIAGTPVLPTLPNLSATPAKPTTLTTPAKSTTPTAAAAADAYVDKLVKAGTGFDPSAEFDPYWFSKYQKSQKATKIASGGYLDDLLANPTSFEELLRTLRS